MSKDNKDPRVHYGPPPETWLWDLYPLAKSAWPNIPGFNDGSGDGNTIDMRLWLRPQAMSNFPPPAYRPAHAPLPPFGFANGGMRRCYVPQPADLKTVRRLWPEIRNPGNPPWPQVEAELILAGRTPDELVKTNSPALLMLLAQVRGKDPQGANEESTVQRAAAFIKKHPGKNIKVTAKHCEVEPNTFRTHISPALKKMGIVVRRGSNGGFYPPGYPAK